eukprot:scaffold4420_cov115-Isochrysis_galbana.AAC.2
MATGDALRRGQAVIRRSDRRTHLGRCGCTLGDRSAGRHTDFSLVLSSRRLRRRRNGITMSGAARERGALSAQHRSPVGSVAARSQATSPTLRPPLEPSQADRRPTSRSAAK